MPERMGVGWSDEETVRLLTSIQKKRTIEEIAADHRRSEGAIQSRLRRLAADYHYYDRRPIEEIQKFTGLSKEQVEDAIAARRPGRKSAGKTVQSVRKAEHEPTLKEVMLLLKDIQLQLQVLTEKIA